jgi:hypothetical protein
VNCVKDNVVRVEFVRRVVRLVTDHQHERRSTVRKTLTQGQYFNFTYIHIHTEKKMHKINLVN